MTFLIGCLVEHIICDFRGFVKYQDGIALISTNPAYDLMYFSSRDVEEKPVKILGKVVELRAKF